MVSGAQNALPANEIAGALRAARLFRASLLVVIGLTIAFSAALHEDLSFDRTVLALALGAIGAVTLVEYVVLRAQPAAWLVALRAVVAFAAVPLLLLATTSTAMAWVIAGWSLCNLAIAVVRVTGRSQSRNVGLPSALLSAALGAIVLLVHRDPVAIIGFFGGYAFLRGVFLGISAFDARQSDTVADPLDSESELPGPIGPHPSTESNS